MKSNPDVSNPLSQDGKDEELDYEPDEENDDIEHESSDSSDSEVEDNDAAKALFMEKFKAGLTAKKVDFTETKDGLLNLPDLNKEKSKSLEESSTSSSESDDDSGQLLLQKKMLMLNAISSPGTNTQDEKRDKESSSESEDDEDAQQILLQKKMLIMQSNSGSVKPNSSMNVENSHLSDDILLKKKSAVPSPGPAEQSEITSVDSMTEPASHMEVDTEEVISPKKKTKVISDSEGEGEEDEMSHDPVGEKLTELGRENVDRTKLKRKMDIESKLKGMKALHEEKIQNQNLKRSSRILIRKETKDSQSESASEKTEGEQEKTTPRRSRRRMKKEVKSEVDSKTIDSQESLIKKTSSPKTTELEPAPKKKTKQELFSDSDSDDETARFDKFSNSENKSKGDLLDTLLTGQNKLLSHEQRKISQPSRSEPVQSVCQTVTEVAQGLPPLDKFKPPIDGCNVSYRMWKLQDNSPGSRGRVFRCIVRSKVAGMKRDGTVVTPSVKLEHQPSFGAETMTPSQVSREWIATVPIPYDRLKMTLPGLVKTFYGPPAPVKRIIKVTNLPAETTKKTMDIALGRCAEYVKQVKVFSPKSLAVKKGETKKQQIAYLYTDSEEMAKTVLRHRGSSIKLSGKTAKMSLVALKRAPICKRVKVAAKKASDEKKAKTKAMAKANHERHEANQKRAKKNRSRRRQPMFEGPRVLRDKKTGRCYGIKRKPEAKAPKFERKSGNAYQTMRAMVRATRA